MPAVAAIAIGAAPGACSRGGLGRALDALFPTLPAGTLAANLIGGCGVGVAVAWFVGGPEVSPEWRLLTITGFLGGAGHSNFKRPVQGPRLAPGPACSFLEHLYPPRSATCAGHRMTDRTRGACS